MLSKINVKTSVKFVESLYGHIAIFFVIFNCINTERVD